MHFILLGDPTANDFGAHEILLVEEAWFTVRLKVPRDGKSTELPV
jgi:hypothetical protein